MRDIGCTPSTGRREETSNFGARHVPNCLQDSHTGQHRRRIRRGVAGGFPLGLRADARGLREAATLYRSPDNAELQGEFVGYAVASCLLVSGLTWAALFHGFVRRRAPSRGLSHFFILLGLVTGVHVLGLTLAIAASHR